MACKDAKRWQGVDALGVMGDSDMSCVLRVLMPGIFSREAVAAACCAASCSCASSAAAAAWPSGCSMAMACMHEQCDFQDGPTLTSTRLERCTAAACMPCHAIYCAGPER